jgi:hypothetical protein
MAAKAEEELLERRQQDVELLHQLEQAQQAELAAEEAVVLQQRIRTMHRWQAQAQGDIPDIHSEPSQSAVSPVDPRLAAARIPLSRIGGGSPDEDNDDGGQASEEHSSLSDSEDEDLGGTTDGVASLAAGSAEGGSKPSMFGVQFNSKKPQRKRRIGQPTPAHYMTPIVPELSVNLTPGFADDVAFERRRQVRVLTNRMSCCAGYTPGQQNISASCVLHAVMRGFRRWLCYIASEGADALLTLFDRV